MPNSKHNDRSNFKHYFRPIPFNLNKLIFHMRPLFIALFSILGLLCSSMHIAADNAPATIPVKKEKKDLDPKGRRLPGQLVYCSISMENGVEIPGVAKEEIESFEAYDNDGFCIAIFTVENDFIEYFIYNFGNIYKVRFLTTDYIYSGYP